jgi:cysteine synthase
MACILYRRHGMIVGISYGANMLVELGVANKESGNSLATEGQVLPDNGSV